MEFIDVIFLSIVEGITEFLPVSSTGHLILASSLLNVPQSEFLKTFQIAIQSGAVLAVINLYWKKLVATPSLILKSLFGLLPTAIIGVIAYPFIREHLLDNTAIVAYSLILGGIAIIVLEKYFFKKIDDKKGLEDVTYKQAFFTGLTQSIAIVPGVSRAAASIFGGMVFKMNRKTATEFSFILALPTIFAATGYDLIQTGPTFSQNELLMLATGTVLSFIVALIAIKWLLKYISTHNFIAFGWYRIIIGIIFLLLILV